ncbi:MAG TPA: Na+/H+ antiporter NhaC family protein [Sandaracinaceae bacterium LLY-WYZ-13_1]|nr:Na+/H+ antiporter NhaC family protein [Sandaracinaceae bacterium LLY-WYZ-13_1]
MRRLTDRYRISRERLAYLVDSTAAPIAGVSLVSTWIAYEVGLFGDLAREIELSMGGYEIFVAVLPFRFYCLSALTMVLLGAWSGRDFGPMYAAERRAAERGEVHAPDAEPLGGDALDATRPPEDAPHRWYNAVIPIAVVVLGVVGGMLYSGRRAVWDAGRSLDPFDLEVWRLAFGGADSANVLLAASVGGSVVAIGLALTQRIVPAPDAAKAWARTVPAMWKAVAILILAWAIKTVCLELGTDRFLLAVLGERVPLTALPLAVFGLAAVIALSTGTSFGTMGILLPVALPLAHALGGTSVELFLVGAAVLDGAIYGDHCSPISDTTVLSSAATGCDHIDHVRTQIPYATTSMAIAAAAYLGVALGLPRWLPYPFIPLATLGLLFAVGERLPRPDVEGEAR